MIAKAPVAYAEILIAGPSHVMRWQANLAKGAAPDLREKRLHLFGFGGAPIWSAKVRDQLVAAYRPGQTKVVLLVGDSRFGNSICGTKDRNGDGYPFADGHEAISRDFLNWTYDQEQAARVGAAIRFYTEAFGADLSIIYWDMFGRRISDMVAGRYQSNGQYDHPSWGPNLPEEGGAARVPLEELLSQPLGDLIRLFLDDSIHPSHMGYHFLTALVADGLSPLDAYRHARMRVMLEIYALKSDITADGRILVAGGSVWITTLRRLVGPAGYEWLKERGLDIRTTDPCRADQHISSANINDYDRFLFVSHEENFRKFQSLNKVGAAAEASGKPLCYLPWEATIYSLLKSRGYSSGYPVPGNLSKRQAQDLWGKAFNEDMVRGMIEIGMRGEPNWRGIKAVFARAAEL